MQNGVLLNGVETKQWDFVENAENSVRDLFYQVSQTSLYNQVKVINALQKNQLAARHFAPSTGYGYDDIGRDVLDRVFADVFHTEDALVRPQFASGTHAIATALFGLLAPGDHLLSVTGDPYDTLRSAIGIDTPVQGSLASIGVAYDKADLTANGGMDIAKTLSMIQPQTKVVFIQRSRGYSWRNALTVDDIQKAVCAIKTKNKDIIILVDNCYGEFVEQSEPTDAGADVIAGSLIKNPGGGIAPTGGYICGRAELIERISYRLTSPGIGREVGSYAASYAPFYQGLFMAPHVVGEAVKGRLLLAQIFETIGFETMPASCVIGGDIIQAIKFNNEQLLIEFCKGIQSVAPIDSFVTPEPWEMPGYKDAIIMAAGTFVQGASIELSADGPIRPPYIAYFQGGLTYEHVKYAALKILQSGAYSL